MEKKDRLQKIENGISILSLLAVIVVVLVCFLLKKKGIVTDDFGIGILTGLLVFYFILVDFIKPLLLHEFGHMLPEKRRRYVRFVLIDLAGNAALLSFVWNIGRANESAVIGAVIYMFCLNLGRTVKREFYES